jgi:hypothetical protein
MYLKGCPRIRTLNKSQRVFLVGSYLTEPTIRMAHGPWFAVKEEFFTSVSQKAQLTHHVFQPLRLGRPRSAFLCTSPKFIVSLCSTHGPNGHTGARKLHRCLTATDSF